LSKQYLIALTTALTTYIPCIAYSDVLPLYLYAYTSTTAEIGSSSIQANAAPDDSNASAQAAVKPKRVRRQYSIASGSAATARKSVRLAGKAV
jgi:hypothetical protein